MCHAQCAVFVCTLGVSRKTNLAILCWPYPARYPGYSRPVCYLVLGFSAAESSHFVGAIQLLEYAPQTIFLFSTIIPWVLVTLLGLQSVPLWGETTQAHSYRRAFSR